MTTQAETRDWSPSAKNFSGKRVLVVDDEPLLCWSVAETLADAGYDVVEAYDAASAIQAASGIGPSPDVVLLDLNLPDSTDLNLLSKLRHLLPATPIVIITAFGNPDLREEAHRLGALALIDKPVEMSELATLVAHARAQRPH